MDKEWLVNNSDYYMWWDFFIMWARYDDGKICKGENFIDIKRGQIYKSQNTLAKLCKTTKGKIQTFLKLLEQDNMITVENDTKCSRITICNYDIYQKPSTNNQSIINQSSTNEQPIINQLSTEINNLKELVSNLIIENNKTTTNSRSKKIKVKSVRENPPTLEEVEAYFAEQGFIRSAKDYLNWFTNANWIDRNGKEIKNWKNHAKNNNDFYVKQLEKEKQQPQQQQQGAGYINGKREVSKEELNNILEHARNYTSRTNGVNTGAGEGILTEEEPF